MPNKSEHIFKKIIFFLLPYKYKLFLSLFLSLVVSFISVFLPVMNQELVDQGLVPLNTYIIVKYALLISILSIIKQCLISIQSWIHIKIQNCLVYDLSENVFRHMLRLKLHYFEENSFFQVIFAIDSNIDAISQTANEQFLNIIVQLIKLLGGLIGLMIISPKLTFIVLIIVVIRYVIMKMLSNKRQYVFEKSLDVLKKYSSWYSDTINGLRIVKLWGLYTKKEKDFKEKTNEKISISKKISIIYLIEDFVSQHIDIILNSLLFIIGGFLVVKQELTIGGLFAFTVYSQLVMQPVFLLISFQYQMLQLKPALDNFIDFMTLEEEFDKIDFDENYKFPQSEINSIRFNNVSKQYGEKQILKNINFEIKKGEKVAIIGQNGSGKSTILDLLLRIKEPTTGSICMNLTPIQEFDLLAYRDIFAVIDQGGFLFDSTVGENLLYDELDNPGIVDVNYKWIFSQLDTIRDGLSTKTGQDGSLLSGGERQKIILLRALLKRSTALVAKYINKQNVNNIKKILKLTANSKSIYYYHNDYTRLINTKKNLDFLMLHFVNCTINNKKQLLLKFIENFLHNGYNCVALTSDYSDIASNIFKFKYSNELSQYEIIRIIAGMTHPGIMIIYYEPDKARDISLEKFVDMTIYYNFQNAVISYTNESNDKQIINLTYKDNSISQNLKTIFSEILSIYGYRD